MSAFGDYAYVSRLNVSDLDPNVSDDPSGLYDRRTLKRLADAAGELFRGPFWLVFEAGRGDVYGPDGGKLHAHAAHHRHDGPAHIERDTLRCRWIYDPLNLWRYHFKHDPPTRELLLEHAVAELLSPSGRLPNVRRPFWSRERLLWVGATGLYDQTFGELPPVLPCGCCRGRYLPTCPYYRAAAAAAARNEPTGILSGYLDGFGFVPDDRPVTSPSGGQIDLLNRPAAAAAAPRPRSRPPGSARRDEDRDVYRRLVRYYPHTGQSAGSGEPFYTAKVLFWTC